MNVILLLNNSIPFIYAKYYIKWYLYYLKKYKIYINFDQN